MATKYDSGSKRRRHLDNGENDSHSDAAELSVVPGRHRRRRRTILRVLFRLVITAVVVSAGLFVYVNWDRLEPEYLLVWINEKLAGGESGDGFPFEITGSSVINMQSTRDGLALLTNNSLVLLNSKGGEVFRRSHGFSKPIMRSNGKYILIADSGGNRIRLETRVSTVRELNLENRITSVDVGSSGSFAVATDSARGYTSEVAVYKLRGEEPIFRWYDSSLIILDVAISPNEDSLAVVGVTAEGGAMKSFLKIFEFNKKDPVAQYSQDGLMLFKVGFFPGGTIAAVGDSAVWVFNKSGTIQQKHSFNDRKIAGYVIGDSAVSVALSNYGGSDGGTVMTVNSSGDKAYEADFEGTFRSMDSYGSQVVMLTSEHMYRIDIKGESHLGEAVKDGRIISTMGRKLMVLGLTSIAESELP
ncbi:MAG TPA: hypothetical protein GXX54_08255 [Clostridiales bacterium]|nr:hypothetical protein [Clostridiales bacterium]